MMGTMRKGMVPARLLRLAPRLLLAAVLVVPPALGQGREVQTIEDPLTSRPDREVHDVSRVTLAVSGGAVTVGVRFARALDGMMFEAVSIYFDCDDDPRTGIGGAELQVRAAVGSRFHPNDWKPPPGLPAPLDRRRTGWAGITVVERGAERRESPTWVWNGTLEPPVVEGKDLRFRVPLKMLRRRGTRYNRHVPVWLEVEGSGSEHPIPVEYLAADDGVPIGLDGEEDDWSGPHRTEDPAGELHPDAAALDLTRVRVEHHGEKLFVGVRRAREGFERPPVEDDVRDLDRIVIGVEPTGGDYLDYREYEIRSGAREVRRMNLRGFAGPTFLECAIDRPAGQTGFRVVVWSDARRIDRVPDDGSFRLDIRPGRPR